MFDSPQIRRAALAGFLGSLMEWYDFYLFGIASALVFNKLFFPDFSAAAGVLASFGAFAVGFVSRPVGAVIFGHIGDRMGRKYALIATTLIMGLGTLAIGLIPDFRAIGAWAPALLIILRLVQGIGIGGEWGGAALVALEHAPNGRRGLIGSLPQVGTPTGLLFATGIFALASQLPNEVFMSWGWRLPFWTSAIFLLITLFIRLNVEETPVFLKTSDNETRNASPPPVIELFRRHPKNIVLATGARLADAATFNVINVFGISYAAHQLGISRDVMLDGFVVAAAVEIVLVPLIGALSDIVGRRYVYMFGVVFSGAFGFAYFPLIASGSTALAWLAIVLALAVGTGFMYAIEGSFFSELFGTSVRYTGISLGYQISALIGGAMTPLIASSLSVAAGGAWWPVALYLAFVCTVSLVCVWLAAETAHRDLASDID